MFRAIASLDAVATKLAHFIDSSELQVEEKARIKSTIQSTALPFLKLQITASGKSTVMSISSLTPILTEWAVASKTLISALPTEQLFPVVDLWRIGFLSPVVGAWVSEAPGSTPSATSSMISEFLHKAQSKPLPRSFVLTLLKFLCNAFGTPALSQRLLSPGPLRDKLTDLVVSQLLEEENQVRTTAASLIFNIACSTQMDRAGAGKGECNLQIYSGVDAEWEIEIVSAVIEGIRREKNEEIREFCVATRRVIS